MNITWRKNARGGIPPGVRGFGTHGARCCPQTLPLHHVDGDPGFGIGGGTEGMRWGQGRPGAVLFDHHGWGGGVFSWSRILWRFRIRALRPIWFVSVGSATITYPPFARFRFGDDRLGEVRHAADIPLGIAGARARSLRLRRMQILQRFFVRSPWRHRGGDWISRVIY